MELRILTIPMKLRRQSNSHLNNKRNENAQIAV